MPLLKSHSPQLRARGKNACELTLSNVGRKWTGSEDAVLRFELAGEVPITTIAARHGRSIRAIELRVRKMRLNGG